MGSHGIRDKVAIVGMGCTPFGEHWDKSADDLLVESATAAAAAAGTALDDIDAFWLGTMGSGVSGLTLSRPLRLADKPVTRLENMCATGTEALRGAAYAVASGAVDIALAVGAEGLAPRGRRRRWCGHATNLARATDAARTRRRALWIVPARPQPVDRERPAWSRP